MDELTVSPYFLAAVFAVIAFIYASVGLGGGSSYTALLSIVGASTLAIPTITLSLNLLVTSVASFNFIRFRHHRLKLILPFVISSIPASYLGGSLNPPEELFYGVLLASLIFVALRIYTLDKISLRLNLSPIQQLFLALLAGALLGLIAGIVGIGGGIYLIPLILILGLGTAKEAAACGAMFIFINSAAGLAARVHHGFIDFSFFLPLAIAVLAGGTVGSYLGAARLNPRTMERLLGVIILLAIGLLIRRILLIYI